MNAIEILQKTSLKPTKQRERILNVFIQHSHPLSSHELYTDLENSMDRATLFRNLKRLCEAEVLHPVSFSEGFTRYQLDKGKHLHIIRCQSCDEIEQIDLCLPKNYKTVLENKGYSNIHHHIEFSGVCGKCKS